MNSFSFSKKQGSSLLELLIGMSIPLILSASLIPMISVYIKKASEQEMLITAHIVYEATEAALAEMYSAHPDGWTSSDEILLSKQIEELSGISIENDLSWHIFVNKVSFSFKGLSVFMPDSQKCLFWKPDSNFTFVSSSSEVPDWFHQLFYEYNGKEIAVIVLSAP
ncbi:MAG: type II secretion system GspH family protein [Eubacterium sp.]|nr:type II secretion system GspH family protein [Eubacterium sp.]